jgi:hypothetical protein
MLTPIGAAISAVATLLRKSDSVMVTTISTISTAQAGRPSVWPTISPAISWLPPVCSSAADRDQAGQQHDHLPLDQRVEIAPADNPEHRDRRPRTAPARSSAAQSHHGERNRGGENRHAAKRLGRCNTSSRRFSSGRTPSQALAAAMFVVGPISSSTSPALIGRLPHPLAEPFALARHPSSVTPCR